MRNSKTLIAVAVAALIPLAGTAFAGDKDKAGHSSAGFDSLDTNRDGRISKVEAAADSKIVFSTADANGDGYLDSKEFKGSKSGSDMPSAQPQSSQPDSSSMPETSGQPDATVPQESTAPPADTETPRQ
jgi:hypothetical protein